MNGATVASPAGVMLVTNKLDPSPSGGRELLCKLNHDVLKETYGDQLVLFELPRFSLRGIGAIFNAFQGYIDGLSCESVADALRMIQARNVGKIFVDGSNLGELVAAVKARYPHVEVSTFFHNVETRFFLGALREAKTPRSFGVLLANYLAERKSVRYSDKIICLSARDSRLLQRLFGRSATHLAPMALQDQLANGARASQDVTSTKFALFVGGAFYANRAGIKWFVNNVSPRIRIKTCIVGKGLEDLREDLDIEGKVQVIGEVESLAQWYRNAHFVIAPIFDGSGMKTKVAEALMHGKKVIGTPEAFAGYEEIADRAGRVCVSADDFVAAIESADEMVRESFDGELRAIYESKYSYEAAKVHLQAIMNSRTPPEHRTGTATQSLGRRLP